MLKEVNHFVLVIWQIHFLSITETKPWLIPNTSRQSYLSNSVTSFQLCNTFVLSSLCDFCSLLVLLLNFCLSLSNICYYNTLFLGKNMEMPCLIGIVTSKTCYRWTTVISSMDWWRRTSSWTAKSSLSYLCMNLTASKHSWTSPASPSLETRTWSKHLAK